MMTGCRVISIHYNLKLSMVLLWLCALPTYYAYRSGVFNFENEILERELNSNSVGFFSDGSNLGSAVFSWMENQVSSLAYFDTRKGDDGDIQRWIRSTYVDNYVTDFVVLVHSPADVLENADVLFRNESYRQLAGLPHRSRWLLFVWTERQLEEVKAQQVTSSLDNIAVMYLTTKQSQQQKEDVWVSRAWTFLWGENRTRTVDAVKTEDSHSLEKFRDLFPNTKRGLNGRHLKIAAKSILDIDLRCEVNPATEQAEYAGLLIQLIGALSRMMNFTYDIWPRAEEMDNLTLVDFFDSVAFGKVDLALTHFQTLWVFDYTATIGMEASNPYRYDTVTGIYRKPKDLCKKMAFICHEIYFYVIILGTYIVSILIAVTLYFLIVYVIFPHDGDPEKAENPDTMRKHETSCLGRCKRLFDGYLHAFAYFLSTSVNQGTTPTIHLMSARIVVGAWNFLIIIFVAMYTASITASIAAVKTAQPPIRSFPEMIARGDYSWGFIGNGIIEENMNVSQIEYIVTLFKDGERIARSRSSIESAAEKFLDESLPYNFVFISFRSNLENWLRQQPNREDYVIMNTTLFETRNGLGFPTGSEINEMVSLDITRLHGTGMIENMLSSQTNRSDVAQRKGYEDAYGTTLSLKIFFVGGIISSVSLCIFVLTVEVITNKIRRKYKQWNLNR